MSGDLQLYLFSITNLVGFVFMFGDLCSVFTGGASCNPTEKVMAFMFSFCLAYVGVFFFVLTYLNKGDHPKLKRLAKFAGNAAVATFAGIIMTGSSKIDGGLERAAFHLGDMVWFFILYILLVSAMSDDTPVAPRTNCRGGWGANPKTLVFLLLIIIIIKLFVLTDFMSMSYIIDEPEVTALASLFWRWCGIMLFEVILAFVFVHEYGSALEQEATIYIVVVMSLLACIAMWASPGLEVKSGLLKQGLFSMVILIIISIVAIIGGRKGWGGNSSGYDTVTAIIV